MKTLLYVMCFVAGLTSAQAQETTTEKFKLSGAGRLRFENQEFTDSLTGSSSFMSIRLRPNLAYKANDELEFVVEPQFAKRAGAEVYTPSSTTANTLGETSGNAAYAGDAATVYQAYMNIKFDSHFSLKGGRQALKYGDELIVGPANWGLYGRSFDALVARWANAGSFVDVIYGKVADFGNRSAGGDRDLYGVYTSWNLGFWFKSVDVYWLQRMDHDNKNTGGPDDGTDNKYSVAGTRMLFEWGAFNLSAEYAKGDGSKVFVGDGSGTDMYTATLGYKVTDKHKVALEYAVAGENWNDLYATTNRALGRTDVVGRRNIEAIALHWTSEFSDYFDLEFDYYRFQRASTDTRAFRTNTTSAFGSATDTSKDLGQELDLTLKYKQNAAITWSVSYSQFLTGSYFEKTLEQAGLNTDRNPAFYYVMLETKF
jgi:hypothetical protein